MPKPCSICTSSQREAIDADIIAGKALNRIAKAFGVPATNMRRHRGHTIKLIAKANRSRAEDLLDGIEHLAAEAKRLQAMAEDLGDVRGAIAALRELTRITELAARVAGELKDKQINVLNYNVHVDDKTATRIAETFLARKRLREVKALGN